MGNYLSRSLVSTQDSAPNHFLTSKVKAKRSLSHLHGLHHQAHPVLRAGVPVQVVRNTSAAWSLIGQRRSYALLSLSELAHATFSGSSVIGCAALVSTRRKFGQSLIMAACPTLPVLVGRQCIIHRIMRLRSITCRRPIPRRHHITSRHRSITVQHHDRLVQPAPSIDQAIIQASLSMSHTILLILVHLCTQTQRAKGKHMLTMCPPHHRAPQILLAGHLAPVLVPRRTTSVVSSANDPRPKCTRASTSTRRAKARSWLHVGLRRRTRIGAETYRNVAVWASSRANCARLLLRRRSTRWLSLNRDQNMELQRAGTRREGRCISRVVTQLAKVRLSKDLVADLFQALPVQFPSRLAL